MKQRDLIIARILLALGVATILFAPYLITRYSWLDLTQTGQIGDTIGGITSPITNIIGAGLVFYALKAQIESNELTREQFEKQELNALNEKSFQYLLDQVDMLRNEINDFGFVIENTNKDGLTTYITYKGASAIEKFLNILPSWISQA